jgi:hypothetical protein
MRRGLAVALTLEAIMTVASIGLASWHNAVFAGTRHGTRTPAHLAAEPSIANGVATFRRTARLGAVADACAATASALSQGSVVLLDGLVDAHVSVTFTTPCAIQLAGSGGVALHDVSVSSMTLNIADTAFGSGQNTVSLSDARFSGGSYAGLLIRLSDPADRVTVDGGSLRYPAGIAIQVRGDRSGVDDGGTVRLSHTTLSARGDDSEGLTVTASTRHGLIAADRTTLDADAIGFVADRCTVAQGHRLIDCGAARLAGDLKAQAAKP